MLNKYNLHIKTPWFSLPWKKIYTKIVLIQKKIYKAAKFCHFCKMHKLQKYLLNSNECKIFSIKSIIEKFYVFYSVKYKNKFFISDIEKFNILKNLYNKKICFLKKHIKNYLIYLSIKPEYSAKFIYRYNCYKKNFNNNLLNDMYPLFSTSNQTVKIRKVLQYFQYFNVNKYFCSKNIYLFINNTYLYSTYWYTQYKDKLQILLNKKYKFYFMQSLISFKNYNYTKYIVNILLSNNLKQFEKVNDNLTFSIKNIEQFYLKFNKIIFYKLKKKYNNIFFNYIYFINNSKCLQKMFHLTQLQNFYISYCI